VNTPTPIIYVMGFCFTPDKQRVVLTRKKKGPSYVVGKLNGVGGKLEEKEDGVEAMIREFKEETGVEIPDAAWEHFANLRGVHTNTHDPFIVMCFRAFHIGANNVRTMEEEEVDLYFMHDLHPDDVPYNLRYLIPMALDVEVEVMDLMYK
jgi:8-oxo-dGTP pyrophosphatase MutT (NUDIX family)